MISENNLSGNKMSLRSTASKQIKRINFISNHLGALGDMLTSTWQSVLTSILALSVPIVFGLPYALQTPIALKNTIPLILIIIGSILLALNVLMINPSQGSQAVVSFKYWKKLIEGNNHQNLLRINSYRFYRRSLDKTILESLYKRHRHYVAVFKVQGSVSETSFENDLIALRSLNKGVLKSMDRQTVRSTINFVGTPRIQKKQVAANATPEMRGRAYDLKMIADDMNDVQTLETYIVLDSKSPRKLQKEINNHINYFSKGLVVTAKLLQGEELKKFFKLLFT